MKKRSRRQPAMSRGEKVARWAYFFVLISFLVPTIFLILHIVFSGSKSFEGAARTPAAYVLMLVQCLLGVVVIHIPSMLERKFRFELPATLYVMYIIFLYCAIFLGEVRNYYYVVPHWDTILHGFSAAMSGMFGFIMVSLLNRDEHTPIHLSPFFVALFSFCFAVMIGTIWEIYEYVADGLLHLNMQHSQTEEGILLQGREALLDTMKDIIVDVAGALLASMVGYFSIRNGKGWASDIFRKLDKAETVNQ